MNTQVNRPASIGLAIGVIFGMSGIPFTDPTISTILFNISGVGLTTGVALLAMRYLSEQKLFLATGFLLFAIGECALTLSAASDKATADSAFAGCMLFYFIGYLLIISRKYFPLWTRITALISALVFLVTASRFYLGYGISPQDPLPGMAYGFLSITLLGWIIFLTKEHNSNTPGE